MYQPINYKLKAIWPIAYETVSRLTRKQSKKDKKAGKLLCNWKFETRKPNYLKSCSPLYCAESDLPAIQNAQLEVSPVLNSVLVIESSSLEP